MPLLKFETKIDAPIERVFDLARSIDLHIDSMTQHNERAVAGRTSGLVKQGETVTWKARHFGIDQKLTSHITKVEKPNLFEDEMVSGAFKGFVHTHQFAVEDGHTIMRDDFDFESPLGAIGELFNSLILTKYMRDLLEHRNELIKKVAESDDWKKYLKDQDL